MPSRRRAALLLRVRMNCSSPCPRLLPGIKGLHWRAHANCWPSNHLRWPLGMVVCSASHRRRWNALSASWSRPWQKRKGNSRMSHRMGLNQASVVEAAAKLVDEEGIEQLTLGHLAERLGIRTPSLYNHVAGLPGLKHDLALYCLRDLLGRVTRATVGKSQVEAINALADAY